MAILKLIRAFIIITIIQFINRLITLSQQRLSVMGPSQTQETLAITQHLLPELKLTKHTTFTSLT